MEKNNPSTFYCIFHSVWVPMTPTQNIRGVSLAGRKIENTFWDFPTFKAQRVMQSAMKLPPHILPTLDELDPTTSSMNTVRDKNVGVYGELNTYLQFSKDRQWFYRRKLTWRLLGASCLVYKLLYRKWCDCPKTAPRSPHGGIFGTSFCNIIDSPHIMWYHFLS